MADKTDLVDLLTSGVDLKNRRIYFGVAVDDNDNPGDFTQASVELAVRALHKMSSEAPGKPIEIYMNSCGGDMYSMLRLHDEILACPCQIKFFGGGAIMSAATWIMAVSDERWLQPNATIMVHELSSGNDGKHTDIQIDASENRRLMAIAYDIYEKNSRMPKDFWEDVCQRDLYLTSQEAIDLGLADKLIEPKKRGNLRKVRQAQLKKTPETQEMRKLVNRLYNRINKVKIPKIELNTPVKEPIDPHLIVDNTPVIEKAEQPQVTQPSQEPVKS